MTLASFNKLKSPKVSYTTERKKFLFIYFIILGLYMNNTKDSQSEYTDTITLKVTDDFKEMLDFLQEKTLLNRSSVIRYAVVEFYKANKCDSNGYN